MNCFPSVKMNRAASSASVNEAFFFDMMMMMGDKDDAIACGQPYFAHSRTLPRPYRLSNGTIKRSVDRNDRAQPEEERNVAKMKTISKFSRLLIYGWCLYVCVFALLD